MQLSWLQLINKLTEYRLHSAESYSTHITLGNVHQIITRHVHIHIVLWYSIHVDNVTVWCIHWTIYDYVADIVSTAFSDTWAVRSTIVRLILIHIHNCLRKHVSLHICMYNIIISTSANIVAESWENTSCIQFCCWSLHVCDIASTEKV